MTTDKLISILVMYKRHLEGKGYEALKCQNPKQQDYFVDKTKALSHVVYMCDETMNTHIPNGKIEKSMRWLGSIQTILFTHGEFSLCNVGDHSRPDL